MNERIRELAGQAGFETEHHKWIFANDNVGEGECHELLEKFAELIVRECAEMVRKNNYQFMSNEQHYGVTSGDILNHFGVTE